MICAYWAVYRGGVWSRPGGPTRRSAPTARLKRCVGAHLCVRPVFRRRGTRPGGGNPPPYRGAAYCGARRPGAPVRRGGYHPPGGPTRRSAPTAMPKRCVGAHLCVRPPCGETRRVKDAAPYGGTSPGTDRVRAGSSHATGNGRPQVAPTGARRPRRSRSARRRRWRRRGTRAPPCRRHSIPR